MNCDANGQSSHQMNETDAVTRIGKIIRFHMMENTRQIQENSPRSHKHTEKHFNVARRIYIIELKFRLTLADHTKNTIEPFGRNFRSLFHA